MDWTTEQIVALAPDTASAKSGRQTAKPAQWRFLRYSGDSLWGECQGSDANPYQTQVDLTEPAFKCTCPSRKFPCKHGVALLLLYAESRDTFAESSEPPDWVTNWITARRDRQAQRPEDDGFSLVPPPVAAPKASSDSGRAKRVSARESKVARGIDDLDLWLADLIRAGLGEANRKPYSYWDAMGARLIDAQAPGLARRVRELAGVASRAVGWQDTLLERLAQLRLISQGYRNLESLPPDLQADVRTAVGFTVKSEELLSLPGVQDLWQVLGVRVTEEDKLRVQRAYLYGTHSARVALLLSFNPVGAPLAPESLFAAGTAFVGELVWYPSAYPIRAQIRERAESVAPLPGSGFPSQGADALAATFADALAKVPWIDAIPAYLNPARLETTVGDTSRWQFRDSENRIVPMRPTDSAAAWAFVAESGGHPSLFFGEWDGRTFLPLAVRSSDSEAKR